MKTAIWIIVGLAGATGLFFLGRYLYNRHQVNNDKKPDTKQRIYSTAEVLATNKGTIGMAARGIAAPVPVLKPLPGGNGRYMCVGGQAWIETHNPDGTTGWVKSSPNGPLAANCAGVAVAQMF